MAPKRPSKRKDGDKVDPSEILSRSFPSVPPPPDAYDAVPDLKIDDTPQKFEEGGWTPSTMAEIGGKAGAFEKTRVGRSTNSMGPQIGAELISIDPELAGSGGRGRAAVETSPCPGCGWPLAVRAAVCTKCGYSKQTGTHVDVKRGEEKKPEAKPDLRFQTFQHDPMTSRGAWKFAIGVLVVSLAICGAFKLADGGSAALGLFLMRFAVSTGMAVGVYLFFCLLSVEYAGPWPLMIIRVGAAMAAAMATQQTLLTVLTAVPILQLLWIVAFVSAFAVYVGFIVELLDVDMQDSIFITLLTLVGQLLLVLIAFPALGLVAG